MNLFRSMHPEKAAEVAETAVFSAMHALVDRLAVAGSAVLIPAHQQGTSLGDTTKHTAMPHTWRNRIIPHAGVKIP